VDGGSKDGEVISSSCLDSGFVHRDHSSIGMSHKTGVGSVSMTSVHSSEGDGGSNGRSSSNISRSLSGKVVSTGSSHGRLVSRDHSSIRMGNKVGVQVEGSSISIGSSVSVVGRNSSISSMSNWGSSNSRSSSNIS